MSRRGPAGRGGRHGPPGTRARAGPGSVCLLSGLLAGCAGPLAPLRPAVAADLRDRTGCGLAPAAAPGEIAMPPVVDLEDGVSSDEVVAMALWNNAAFQETLAELGLARADLVQAGLLSNPVLSLLFPLGPKQLEFALTLPLEALWLRPRRLAIARIDAERVGQQLVQSGLDLVFEVRLASAELVRARARARLAEDATRLRQHLADLSERRWQAGDLSGIDLATARVRAALAETDSGRRARDVTLAEDRLRGLMGLTLDPTPLAFDDAPPEGALAPSVDAMVHAALAGRPDLRAAELAGEAAAERAGLARTAFFTFAAVLDANARGTDGFEAGPGLQVSLPILHRNDGEVARAEAGVDRAARHYVTVRDRIALEVTQAHTRLLQALEDLERTRTEILPALQAVAAKAERAYANGDLSFLQVLETTTGLIDARIRETELDAALRRARAELERHVGGRLDGGPRSAPAEGRS